MRYLSYYLIGINVLAFLAFGLDKAKAKFHAWRIPEKTLLGLATIGGSIGAILGMLVFHHKVNRSRKPAFVFGIPVMLILQISALIYYLC